MPAITAAAQPAACCPAATVVTIGRFPGSRDDDFTVGTAPAGLTGYGWFVSHAEARA
ncbi:MAG: hypothetical protein WAK26_03840 [Terracidiphilus sp.]